MAIEWNGCCKMQDITQVDRIRKSNEPVSSPH